MPRVMVCCMLAAADDARPISQKREREGEGEIQFYVYLHHKNNHNCWITDQKSVLEIMEWRERDALACQTLLKSDVK